MAQTPCLYLQQGELVDYTPGSAVTAGDVVLLGTLPCIAPADIAAGVLGSLALGGVWKVPQKAEIITAGDDVYWDASGDPVTGTAGTGAATGATASVYYMGVAVKTTAATDSYVQVRLNAANRTATVGGAVTATGISGEDSTLTITGLAGTETNNGGLVSVTAGASGDGATGTGGAASLVGGAAASTNGAGGAASVTGGAGKGNQAGGAASVTGGVGGATGAGGAVAVTGGAGGSTSGTGGAVTVAGGAGTAGNANGGAISVLGGNAHGSGTDGVANIGTSNTSAVNIAAASIATSIVGPLNRTAGASTAAAGSATADAGELPAATAGVYPTTAADDTKGVRINAADKVTGRMLFIGNGVSNKILKVYAPSGGAINGAAADAAFSSVSGKGVIIYCLDATANTWLAW
jgi:predicted RecA/RadA family phage recombinase